MLSGAGGYVTLKYLVEISSVVVRRIERDGARVLRVYHLCKQVSRQVIQKHLSPSPRQTTSARADSRTSASA